MLILEIFDSGGEAMMQMRQSALDVIIPYLGQDVPFLTINQVISGLKNNTDLGIVIDRGLVMDLLNPDEVKAVDKIEGNRIYLSHPEDATNMVDDEEEQKQQEQTTDKAQDQAKKQMQNPATDKAQDQAKKQLQQP